MDKYQQLEERLHKVEKRNQLVETDKAWETSNVRRLMVILFTYITISIYFHFVLRIDPWLNAIVPTVGFFLSTLTLPFLKKLWTKYIYKNN